MKTYKVKFVSKIAGGSDHVFVIAESEQKALEIGKPMLNTHKLVPDFLNSYSRYSVECIMQ